MAVWLVEDGVHPVHLFRASIRCTSGGGGTRKAENTVAESLVRRRRKHKPTVACSIGRVSTKFGEVGGYLGRRRAKGVFAEPLCATTKGANRWVSEGKASCCDLSPRSVFFARGPTRRSVERARFLGRFFRETQGFERLNADLRPGFTSSRYPTPWTSVL